MTTKNQENSNRARIKTDNPKESETCRGPKLGRFRIRKQQVRQAKYKG